MSFIAYTDAMTQITHKLRARVPVAPRMNGGTRWMIGTVSIGLFPPAVEIDGGEGDRDGEGGEGGCGRGLVSWLVRGRRLGLLLLRLQVGYR